MHIVDTYASQKSSFKIYFRCNLLWILNHCNSTVRVGGAVGCCKSGFHYINKNKIIVHTCEWIHGSLHKDFISIKKNKIRKRKRVPVVITRDEKLFNLLVFTIEEKQLD